MALSASVPATQLSLGEATQAIETGLLAASFAGSGMRALRSSTTPAQPTQRQHAAPIPMAPAGHAAGAASLGPERNRKLCIDDLVGALRAPRKSKAPQTGAQLTALGRAACMRSKAGLKEVFVQLPDAVDCDAALLGTVGTIGLTKLSSIDITRQCMAAPQAPAAKAPNAPTAEAVAAAAAGSADGADDATSNEAAPGLSGGPAQHADPPRWAPNAAAAVRSRHKALTTAEHTGAAKPDSKAKPHVLTIASRRAHDAKQTRQSHLSNAEQSSLQHAELPRIPLAHAPDSKTAAPVASTPSFVRAKRKVPDVKPAPQQSSSLRHGKAQRCAASIDAKKLTIEQLVSKLEG